MRELTLDQLDLLIRALAAYPSISPEEEDEHVRTLSQLLHTFARTKAFSLPSGPITKWDALHRIERVSLDLMAFVNPATREGPGQCSKCGTQLPTEGDFARHYVVTDRRYLNLGSCPNPAK